MRELEFVVPGKPQGKARARTFYSPRIGRMCSITPEQTVLYENLVKICYNQAARGREMEEGPVIVRIEAVFSPPASASQKRREIMLAGLEYPTSKPDVDNIVKVILDALNGLAYKDDKNVVGVIAAKKFEEEACVRVKITPVNGSG